GDDDGLDVDELADADGSELAAVTRALHPAEGKPGIGGYHAVDERQAGLEVAHEPLELAWVPRPSARAEPVPGVVCARDCLGDVPRSVDERYRTEHLFAICRRCARDVGERGWRVVIAGSFEGAAPQQEPRPGGDARVDLSGERSAAGLGGERADVRIVLH